jgi:hypothetical protein
MTTNQVQLVNEATGFFGRVDLPYKVTRYDPERQTHYVVASKRTFAEAYNHPKGTHVVHTHGTSEEVQRMVTGVASPEASATKRIGIGFLLAGPIGAAVGAATSGGGGTHKLPNAVVTPKSWTERIEIATNDHKV